MVCFKELDNSDVKSPYVRIAMKFLTTTNIVIFVATIVASCGGGGTQNVAPIISAQPTAKTVLGQRTARF
jgi:hypothetical protein